MKDKIKSKLKMLYLIWQELDDAETVVITDSKGIATHIQRGSMFPVVQPTLKVEFKPQFNSIDKSYGETLFKKLQEQVGESE